MTYNSFNITMNTSDTATKVAIQLVKLLERNFNLYLINSEGISSKYIDKLYTAMEDDKEVIGFEVCETRDKNWKSISFYFFPE